MRVPGVLHVYFGTCDCRCPSPSLQHKEHMHKLVHGVSSDMYGLSRVRLHGLRANASYMILQQSGTPIAVVFEASVQPQPPPLLMVSCSAVDVQRKLPNLTVPASGQDGVTRILGAQLPVLPNQVSLLARDPWERRR